ncbi:hypothetical protein SISSUDRAFT_1131980 [Sistotremastrum suecicum HHB10207 ss-3]|uniref:Aminoglycoside phosphotransferase domain-containing protein n=1 Tax=Sistotremastrum suecicum HHB10207 ss-3 TaxID=1314776 RepID=A0A165ZFM0_9AGAM|nr:hypothetical protein SISSUDRAFT_1131980 [Sistotremastrum suecicum HHB10207 ss-3]
MPPSVELEKLKHLIEVELSTPCLELAFLKNDELQTSYRIVTVDGREFQVRCYGEIGETEKRKLESEIATLRWLFPNTTIPVAEIHEWDLTTTKNIGCAYIIQRHIPGISLDSVWDSLEPHVKEKVARKIATYESQLFSRTFKRFGSLYHDQNKRKFVVGPMEVTLPVDTDHTVTSWVGPWKDTKSYLEELCQAVLEVQEKKRGEVLPLDSEDPKTIWLDNQTDIIRALHAVIEAGKVTAGMSPDLFYLSHPDFGNLASVIVDPDDRSKIVGVNRWEDARIMPLWKVVPSSMTVFDNPQLRKIRIEVISKIVPKIGHALDEGGALRALEWILMNVPASEKSQEIWLQRLRVLVRGWIKDAPKGTPENDALHRLHNLLS